MKHTRNQHSSALVFFILISVLTVSTLANKVEAQANPPTEGVLFGHTTISDGSKIILAPEDTFTTPCTSCPPIGGIEVESTANHVTAMAFDDRNRMLYWAETDLDAILLDVPTPSRIFRKSIEAVLDPGDNETAIEVVTQDLLIHSLAIDVVNRSRLYWAGDITGEGAQSRIEYVVINPPGAPSPFSAVQEWGALDDNQTNERFTGLVHIPDNGTNDVLAIAITGLDDGGEIVEVPHSSNGDKVNPDETTFIFVEEGINPPLSQTDITSGIGGLGFAAGTYYTLINEDPADTILAVTATASSTTSFSTSDAFSRAAATFATDPAGSDVYFGALVQNFSTSSSITVLGLISEPGPSVDTREELGRDFSPNVPFTGHSGVVIIRDCDPDTNPGLPDTDGDGVIDCLDQCPAVAEDATAPNPGSGCPCLDFNDPDGDGILNCEDSSPFIPAGSSVNDLPICSGDFDNDDEANCVDPCPFDGEKTSSTSNICGCGISDTEAPGCLNECESGFENLGCGCGVTPCDNPPSNPQLTPATRLTTPARLTVMNKKVVCRFPTFSGATRDISSFNPEDETLALRVPEMARRRGVKPRLKVEVRKLTNKGKLRRITRKIIRKNVIRIARLKRGLYEVRYQALIKNRKRTVAKTEFSPASSFTIF